MRIQNLIEISKSNADLPEGRKYPILYADPPWQYERPPMGENRAIEILRGDISFPGSEQTALADLPAVWWFTASIETGGICNQDLF